MGKRKTSKKTLTSVPQSSSECTPPASLTTTIVLTDEYLTSLGHASQELSAGRFAVARNRYCARSSVELSFSADGSNRRVAADNFRTALNHLAQAASARAKLVQQLNALEKETMGSSSER